MILGFKSLGAIVFLVLITGVAPCLSATNGLLGEWNFDEGAGEIAHDSSGNGHDAKIHDAAWVKRSDGFAISFNGLNSYIDCGSSGLTEPGPVTLEAWIKPMRKGHGEATLFGESMSGYLLTYYNCEYCEWYIGGGQNGLAGRLDLGAWNHVVATFDGNQVSLWINGRLAASHESKVKTFEATGRLRLGTAGRPDLAKFKGMLSKVRIYNRSLAGEEVSAHYKAEATGYGVNPAWFTRVKATPYYYWDRGKIVVEADYRGLQPLDGKGKLDVTLSSSKEPDKIIQQQVIEQVPEAGVVNVNLAGLKLPEDHYLLRVRLEDGKGARPVEELSFSYPPKFSPLPSPSDKTVAPLPPSPLPTSFTTKVGKGGGIELTVKGVSYPFESRISWPNGDFNRLTANAAPYAQGEKSWKASIVSTAENTVDVEAAGDFYSIHREVKTFPTHVSISDTYTNTTKQDLGLLIYNEMPLKSGQVTGSWLSGYEEQGRLAEMSFPDYSPSVFVTDTNTGIGMIPIDDVYVVQSIPYVEESAAGLGTEKFALAPGKSYTLEWAIYPTGSGDYYDFINNFRKAEGRLGFVAGEPGFIGSGPPEQEVIDKINLKIGILSCIFHAVDDPELAIEGFEFMDFPKEMQHLKGQAAAIHGKYPWLKVLFHVAHSLYATKNPEKFADSQVIGADGKQVEWGSEGSFSKKRHDEGWRFWIFYPTPGNSFHRALLKSADVMMDELGFNGAFMDGFLAGYISQWTYGGHWDEHSAEIDLKTKTIKRKVGSIVLLSQPSMIEFTRKIRDKGGVVVANNTVFTRSIAREQHIIFDCECASGPQQHLAPNVIALALPSLTHEKETYLDMLDKLSWGELWMSYGEPYERFPDPTSPMLAAKEFPITFEEIRSGLVKGKERIVTMNSGVYGWLGSRDLHVIFKFDARGALVPHEFVTTADQDSVRTELKFNPNESAVIEPIPVRLDSMVAVNVRVTRYDGEEIRLLLNGRSDAVVRIKSGLFPVTAGTAYKINFGGSSPSAKEKDGMISLPLKLDGEGELVIAREQANWSPSQRREIFSASHDDKYF